MLKNFLLTFLIAVPLQLVAQPTTRYPRTVLNCKMTEGGAQLSEDKADIFSYRGTYGFDGTPAGGEAKLDLVKKDGKCFLEIRAGKGTRAISRSFSWSIIPFENPNSISEASSQDGDCQFKPRYSKSIAQCVLPTLTKPGNAPAAKSKVGVK
ncbi:MAG: hypothetical protein JNL11_09745 [Bdellovibrionaceae bacterium]|nr:hypothetical protein [Pseudobdellovibrionaceae bacterium]